jgi:hypothetical protein
VVDAGTVADIEAWDADLPADDRRVGWLFAQPEPKETLVLLVRATLAVVAKKNYWACPNTPVRDDETVSALLNAASWDADPRCPAPRCSTTPRRRCRIVCAASCGEFGRPGRCSGAR